ncbi:hypothetical protein CY34DRAFT_808024 [Suillus luteus UH-Slu-Lm8-n1]|uniref:Uncharacterized protein n=1 Tax=Suillus luteus UH-Slu-Lm8-n1 TaxID=930992 RepID=A0A0D0AD81_9AGAM|nr:hypothetical protein CY34DRAFT_808024 [Suillus luteus UH-Slu-Lm8-n1]
MSQVFVRNLSFQAHDLGREATLLLTFDGNMKGIYEKFFPIVWKWGLSLLSVIYY